ncbi:MAG: tRNA (adenosine(37)-N6)-threonylcarbamoyltransferase complex transferase subunit TsaD [Flavisolibacter sp.]
MQQTGTTITILAIESSCDETSAAICSNGKILSNIIANQEIHEKYGGVVPELASRAHIQNIVPVVEEAFLKSGFSMNQINAIAFTQAPGLIGSLLVGSQFAKALAFSLNIPLITVHHMHAHVLANLIDDPQPIFPFLCLTVSGGHTQIVLAKSPYKLEVLGETLDDAAGEAFDKSAKLIGLPYPGGPLIDRYAKKGNPKRFKFSEPQVKGFDFSFSGLKTSILYFLQKETAKDAKFIENNLADLCASIQHTIVSILLKKFQAATQQTGVKTICLAGGVSANSALRLNFEQFAVKHHCKAFIPRFEYCTDNAAMIAITGFYKYLAGDFADLSARVSAKASWD